MVWTPRSGLTAHASMRLSAKSIADVLERIVSGKVKANEMERLLPWAWKAEREAIAQQERQAA